MAESLSTALIIHTTALGLSRNYHNWSRFSDLFGSDVKANTWRAKLSTIPSSRHSRCRSTEPNKFAPKVSTLEYNSAVGDEKPKKLEDFSEPSFVSETRPQFLEERDEQKLSWRLLKLSRKDRVTSALKLFASMDFVGLKPDSHACNSLLSCLLRNERVEDALRVFERMKSNAQTTEHTYTLILRGIADVRGFEPAFGLFENLVENEDHRNRFDAALYNMMLSLGREAKDWRMSERVWRTMGCHNVGNAATFRILVATFLECCQYELAVEAYREMARNGLQPDTSTSEAVVIACVKDGRWRPALGVFRDVLARGERPNIVVHNALIHALGNDGQVGLAFKVYDCLKSAGHEPTAYTWNGLLVGLCRGERYGDALLLFDRVRRESPRAVGLHLYNTALAACQRLGAWRRAVQIVWEMEGAGLCVPVTSYNRVIGACEAGNVPDAALKVYQHMVHRKVIPDTFTLLSLIRACVWGSRWDEVLEILKMVPPNAHLYNAAIQGLCLRRKTDSATKLYQEMRGLGLAPDGKTWAMMLRHLPKTRF